METERLTLRQFTLEDAPKMYENWASDTEVTKYLMWKPHLKVETTVELLEDWVKGYDDKKRYDWCIELKENKEPIGSIGVIKVLEQAKLMEIGYCISKKYWHQGIASEAVQAVINFLFDEIGVNRVEARHDPRNPYSGKVMENCGMYYEGTRIEADWNNSGICDEVLYGLTQKQRGNLNKKTQEPSKTIISDETIEYVGILAKLELSSEEKENAKKDMGKMLDYINKLNELDTTDVEPMSHVFPINNVFREDIVVNSDDRENMLKNAPEKKDGSYRVPKTVE